MSSRNRLRTPAKKRVGTPARTSSDRAVLSYLHELARAANGDACTASIPKIALACDISERQVQLSTGRLIEAGLLIRVGYDFSNPDRTKRGTVYKVPRLEHEAIAQANGIGQKKSVKLLLFWSEDQSGDSD